LTTGGKTAEHCYIAIEPLKKKQPRKLALNAAFVNTSAIIGYDFAIYIKLVSGSTTLARKYVQPKRWYLSKPILTLKHNIVFGLTK